MLMGLNEKQGEIVFSWCGRQVGRGSVTRVVTKESSAEDEKHGSEPLSRAPRLLHICDSVCPDDEPVSKWLLSLFHRRAGTPRNWPAGKGEEVRLRVEPEPLKGSPRFFLCFRKTTGRKRVFAGTARTTLDRHLDGRAQVATQVGLFTLWFACEGSACTSS